MLYELNGKKIKIPDEEIKRSMEFLGLSKSEAIKMYLEDEGYLDNPYVDELTAKAKEAKISHDAKSEKPRKNAGKPRERKPDEEKEKLIDILANALIAEGIEAKVANKSKIIEFSIGENHYKLDLIKQRPPKEEK